MRSAATIMLIALLLSGYVAAPHVQTEVKQVQPQSLGLAIGVQPIAPQWWKEFGDPQLDQLIKQGLAENPTLAAALARVRRAQASVDVAHAAQGPQITADGQALDQRFSDHYIYPPPYAGTTRWTATAQANLSWDLDLFGRQKEAVSQARSTAAATALDAEAARLTLSISIAQTSVSLAQADRMIGVTDGFVKSRERALAYTQARVRNKLASEFDLRQAETLLA